MESGKPDKQDLIDYLRMNWKDPGDYVIEKFRRYDYIIIGEPHRIKHQVEFIKNLIPRLYKAGVYDLGMEFGSYELQDEVDRLITAKEYDEDLARSIMFRNSPTWGYNEYLDIYREAWKLNKSLPDDAQKFRVVNLCYTPDWKSISEEDWNTKPRKEIMQKVWNRGDYDEHMANVVFREFVDKKKKALIYCGINHGLTHYHQPVYDYEDRKVKFYKYVRNRMGNILYDRMPEHLFFIVMHSPWEPIERLGRETKMIYPVDGIIDGVMREFVNKETGFDVKGSPFGEIKDRKSSYSVGYEDFKLGVFCDGYIFQKHFSDFEGCTVDSKFITKENFNKAVQMLHPLSRKLYEKPIDLIDVTKRAADFRKRYGYLK